MLQLCGYLCPASMPRSSSVLIACVLLPLASSLRVQRACLPVQLQRRELGVGAAAAAAALVAPPRGARAAVPAEGLAFRVTRDGL